VIRDFYSSSVLLFSHESLFFQFFHPWPQNEEPQAYKCFSYTFIHDSTSRNPKVGLKKLDGSFPMVEKVGLNQEEGKILLSLSEPMHKMFYNIKTQELEVREPKIKIDHKPLPPFEPIFNLRVIPLHPKL